VGEHIKIVLKHGKCERMYILNKKEKIISLAIVAFLALTSCSENIGNADGTTENTEVTTVEEIAEVTTSEEIETSAEVETKEKETEEDNIEEVLSEKFPNVKPDAMIEVIDSMTAIPQPGTPNYFNGKKYDLNEILNDGIHSFGYWNISGELIEYVGEENFKTVIKEGEDKNKENINELMLKVGEDNINEYVEINGIEYQIYSIADFVRDFDITKEEWLEFSEEHFDVKYYYNLSEVFPEETE
jgi:hypothetical protein